MISVGFISLSVDLIYLSAGFISLSMKLISLTAGFISLSMKLIYLTAGFISLSIDFISLSVDLISRLEYILWFYISHYPQIRGIIRGTVLYTCKVRNVLFDRRSQCREYCLIIIEDLQKSIHRELIKRIRTKPAKRGDYGEMDSESSRKMNSESSRKMNSESSKKMNSESSKKMDSESSR